MIVDIVGGFALVWIAWRWWEARQAARLIRTLKKIEEAERAELGSILPSISPLPPDDRRRDLPHWLGHP